eukprot:4826472-Pleurochrysis_carterae.AAC.3
MHCFHPNVPLSALETRYSHKRHPVKVLYEKLTASRLLARMRPWCGCTSSPFPFALRPRVFRPCPLAARNIEFISVNRECEIRLRLRASTRPADGSGRAPRVLAMHPVRDAACRVAAWLGRWRRPSCAR